MPGVGGYQYGAIFTNKVTSMRFLIIVKSKNVICNKSKIVFNKIKIYTGMKIQYFWSNNAKKYQLLVSYFEKKDIIREKSASYIQN